MEKTLLRDNETYAILASSSASIQSFASKISQHIDHYKIGTHPKKQLNARGAKSLKRQQKLQQRKRPIKQIEQARHAGKSAMSNAMVEDAILDGMTIRRTQLGKIK